MHIFPRYSHLLKIARIRQYLYRDEGVEHWRKRAIAEAVPGFIHVSLFLYSIGLADFLFSTHLTVSKFTITPIACGLHWYYLHHQHNPVRHQTSNPIPHFILWLGLVYSPVVTVQA